MQKNIGEQFKRTIHYQSLPKLFHRQKPVQQSLEEIENKDMGLCSLFKPEQKDGSELWPAASIAANFIV